MLAVQIVLSALGIYLITGLLFGLVFIIAGVQRTDHAASGAGIGFRLIIFPGVAVLWPLLLSRWIRVTRS